MKLLTKEVLKKFDASGRDEDKPVSEILVLLKFFDPTGRYTLYVTEAEKEGDDYIMFGFCVSPLGEDCDELGYTSFNEIAAVKGRFGLGIERDMHLPDGYSLADAYKDNGCEWRAA